MKTTAVLLLILAFSLGCATFIEDKFDTNTARALVYNSKWFEFLLLLLVLNFIGNIQKYKMLSVRKIPMLTFHLAFIALIIGSTITRYVGFEGSMHIREGKSSNILYSNEPYLLISAKDNNNEYSYDKLINFSALTDNSFSFKISTKDKGVLSVSYKDYIRNAIEKIVENVGDGNDVLQLTVSDRNGREDLYISNGDVKEMGGLSVSFNNNAVKGTIRIFEKNGKLNIVSPVNIVRNDMMASKIDTISKDTVAELQNKRLYSINGTLFVLNKLFKNAKLQLVSSNEDVKTADALIVNAEYNGKKQEVAIIGGAGYSAIYQDVNFNGADVKMAFGEKPMELPFFIYLNDFILARYPGSMSPSSFESNVTLIDNRNNLRDEHRIFMNNVLNYDGYRFFQSSYDPDEKGTILSVNHDFYGTWISYFGYFLLALGFLLNLLNKNSRFSSLGKKINEIRKIRKETVMVIALIAGLNLAAFSENNSVAGARLQSVPKDEASDAWTNAQNPISALNADNFGHLIVQTFDGRFEPMHTLAYDVMHKISKKDKFDLTGKGKMDAMQAFLDMFLDMNFWKAQDIIYTREKSIRDIIGINKKYASFNDFFSSDGKYKLAELAEKAFRKKPIEQNALDKEVLKVDERVNICMDVFKGNYFKIFPQLNSLNNKYISWYDTLSRAPLTGGMQVINDDLQLADFNYSNILRLYFTEVFKSLKSNDYTRPDKIVGYIDDIQRQNTPEELLPGKKMVDVEIYYNKAKIFTDLMSIYGILSLILLTLAFIDNFRRNKSKIITYALNFFIVLLVLAFLYHTYGMVLRWYLTGHAPWSNGYEALLLVAWGGLVAGFSFMRYSKITLAATAVLAFSMLMTAGHSSYDPQLTNLQPVLKSYWLIVHVAVITISYGFLGLGFILGIINMFIFLFKSGNNASSLNLLIKELTYINEMNLTIGLALATVGTFLGGIWASESWGRYWGWDAKETWALIIVITYSVILHFRMIPKLNKIFVLNVASVLAFSSVLMTFIGVNYYLSKGLHSYASGETPVFPVWAWIMIISLFALIIAAGINEKRISDSSLKSGSVQEYPENK